MADRNTATTVVVIANRLRIGTSLQHLHPDAVFGQIPIRETVIASLRWLPATNAFIHLGTICKQAPTGLNPEEQERPRRYETVSAVTGRDDFETVTRSLDRVDCQPTNPGPNRNCTAIKFFHV